MPPLLGKLNNSSNIQTSGYSSSRESEQEVDRLQALHEDLYFRSGLMQAHASELNGRRILAPVDLANFKKGLSIFDVDCADGCWLRGLNASSAPQPSNSTGTTRREHCFTGGHMPSYRPRLKYNPPNIHMIPYNLTEDWPKELQGQFDFVNMANILPPATELRIHPQQVLARQIALVKPGGWLQVTEMVPLSTTLATEQEGQQEEKKPEIIPDKSNQAMHLVWGARAAFTDIVNAVLHRPTHQEICNNLVTWMKDAGLSEIGSEDVTVRIGKKSVKPGEKLSPINKEVTAAIARGWKRIVATEANGALVISESIPRIVRENEGKDEDKVKHYKESAKGMPSMEVLRGELQSASGRVEELLMREGGEQVFRTVWGRKTLFTDATRGTWVIV